MKPSPQKIFSLFAAFLAAIRTTVFAAFQTVRDRWLLVAVLLALAIGAQGFWWGKYNCLNLDRMAFRSVTSKSRPYLHPRDFRKPPFYTYVNHFLADVPANAVGNRLFWLDPVQRKQVFLLLRMGLARALNLGFFAGSIILVFAIARGPFGLPSARLAALLMATSAGFVPYAVFLTTDMALVFMMLAAFACAVKIPDNPGMGVSVAAGLLAGLACATKYNGLFVASALPVAHLLAGGGNPVLACLRRPSAWVCGLCVPLGFVLGNPYAVLNWPMFSADFLYNLKVTPVYNGVTQGNSYGAFFFAFGEIFGWPGTLFIAAGLAAGGVILSRKDQTAARRIWLLAAVVFIVSAWKIGGFPRIATRFVLPAAPFALLMGAAGFGPLLRVRWATVPIAAAVLSYNVVCGWWVGTMFRQDPRMAALALAEARVGARDTIERSGSMPRIQDLPGRDLQVFGMPSGIEINSNFQKIFAGDGQMQEELERLKSKTGSEWFSPSARAARNPGWIFWSSIDVEQANRDEYEALFKEGSGYRVVFDATSPEFPWWSYPRYTEFVRNRVTVWEKASSVP